MRMPNRNVLDELYFLSSSNLDACVTTSRYVYNLYLDVVVFGCDVIQRSSIRHPEVVDRIVFNRPACYYSLFPDRS